ncbi:MAG: biopolymer transporter ExbD, partial [Thiohalocapsa sp.]
MRRRRYRIEVEEAALDMTPMLDIVFIMLIFFVVTASFLDASGVEVETPTAHTAVRQGRDNIVIAITGDDRIWIDRAAVAPAAVQAAIARLRAANPEASVLI